MVCFLTFWGRWVRKIEVVKGLLFLLDKPRQRLGRGSEVLLFSRKRRN
jgi:hypothetical protein